MQLEKILEEIKDELKDIYLDIANNYNISDLQYDGDKVTCLASKFRCDAGKRIENIIRKHMNDGWIPVEERLPEDEEMVLVTCQTKSGRRSMNKAWYGDGFWHGTGSMSGVIAWHPLPEPYRPAQEAAQRPEWQKEK